MIDADPGRRNRFLACDIQQGPEFPQDFGQGAGGKQANAFGIPSAPIQAFDLVGKDDPGDRQPRRDLNLERIALRLARN
jgi:hypothetical protein